MRRFNDLFKVRFLPRTEGIDNISCITVHNRENFIALGQNYANRKSAIQILKSSSPQATSLASNGIIPQKASVTALSWVDDLLFAGNSSGEICLYKLNQGENLSLGNIEPRSRFSMSQNSSKVDFAYTSPGSWVLSDRINRVCAPLNQNDMVLALQNSFCHLWSVEKERSIYSQEISNGTPIFAAAWNIHSNAQYVVGGLSGTVKIYDTRKFSKSSTSSVVWRVAEAHTDSVKDISWSPLVPYWFASCSDDGSIKCWDIRSSKEPFRHLKLHTDSVSSVSWSKSHAEILVSGGFDRTVRLWNLRSNPHYLVQTHENFTSPVVGVGFSSTDPFSYVSASKNGEICVAEITEPVLENFVSHRFTEEESVERSIENELYFRNMEKAYDAIINQSKFLWKDRKNPKSQETLTKLVTLCSATIFDSIVSAHPDNFSKIIKDLSYHISPLALKRTLPSESNNHEILLLRLRLALIKLIEQEKHEEILSLENDIISHLNRDIDALDMESMRQLTQVILPHNFLGGLRFCLKVANLLKERGRFNDFINILHLLLYPTIYHSTSGTFEAEGSLSKKATITLERDLRNPKIMIPELELLYNVTLALTQADSCGTIVALMDGQYKVLSQFLHKTHLNCLLELGHLDKFFVIASNIAQPLQGYEFYEYISDLMENVGYPKLHAHLEKCLVRRENSDDLSELKSGIFIVLNIAENASFLSNTLKESLPTFLKRFTEEIQLKLARMKRQPSLDHTKRDNEESVDVQVDLFLAKINQIKELKQSNTTFFEEQIQEFVDMLHVARN